MKKNWWKRAAGLGLALAAAVGLSACGGDKNVNSSLAKEGVYKFKEITLPEFEADYYNIQNSFQRDGRIYMIVRLEHWSSADNNQTDIRLLSMNEDGSGVESVRLEIPSQDGAGSGTSAPGGNVMPLDTEDGEDGDTEPEEDTESDETEGSEEGAADIAVEPDYEGSDYYEYTSYGNFLLAPDGGVCGIRHYQYESYGEEYYSIQKYYYCRWDSAGKFLQETELKIKDPEREDEWVGINNISIGQDGTLYMMLSGESSYLMTVDPQGNASKREELPEEIR